MSSKHPWWHQCGRWERKGFTCPFGGQKVPYEPEIDWDVLPPARNRDRSRLRPGQAVAQAEAYLQMLAQRTAAAVAQVPRPAAVPVPDLWGQPDHLRQKAGGFAKPIDVKGLVLRLMEAGLLAAQQRGKMSPVALEKLLVTFLANEAKIQGKRWYRQTDWNQVLGGQNLEWLSLKGAWLARVGRFMSLTGGAMKGFGGGGSGAHR